MDDCNLEKLSIKPGKLSPVFHMNTTEYHATVGSNVEKVTFDCLTRDTSASYSISNSGGSKTVPLKEGQVNEIKIEVTAEDGTTKNYFVHIRRLSANDATLSNLKADIGSISPEFSPDVFEYNVLLPVDKNVVSITPSVPDAKAVMTVNNEKPGTPISLNLSSTIVNIEVVSPDGSNKQNYKVVFTRKQVPRFIRFANGEDAMQYECPVSLTALYQPITIKDSDPKHSFSCSVIEELTKTSKVDPITEMPLVGEWRVEDFDLDKKMSDVTGCIPLITGGCSDVMKLSELGTKVKECNQTPKLNVEGIKYSTEAEVKHTVQVKKWEKQLQQVYDESNVSKLCKAAENFVQKYFSSLPKPGRTQKYNEGESPLDHLTNAAYNYATAIKQKGTDANIHMQFGLVLEEKYYAEDLFGLKKDTDSAPGFASLNMAAKESSKEEECDAICALKGVTATAPLSLKLKAIDQEYHHLVESGQSGKADHVQALFQWKSKQATQEGAAAQKASDDTSPLGQASVKYLDALSLDESKSVYNFHVGRTMVIQGEYDKAVKRLEAALGWNDKHQMAKFYLGFALCLQKGGPGARTKEVIGYLAETLETLLQQNTDSSLKLETSQAKATLHAENLLRNNNVHLLRGFVQLGKILRTNTDVKDCMSANDVFHNAALLASQVLPTMVRGDSYKQVEWVILEAHSQLLEILLETQKDNKKLIAQRCLRLSALINNFTIPQNPQLLALQLKTCKMLIEIQPCSSHALYMLGASQIIQYDNDPDSEVSKLTLEEAKSSFKASISLEGKPAAGDVPSEITSQKWWQDKVKLEEEKKKAAEAQSKAAAPVAGAKGVPAGRGGATARGAPAGRGAAAARGGTRGGAAAGRGAPARGGAAAGRGAPAARGGAKAAAPARGGATTAKPAAKPASAKGTRPASAKKSHSCEAVTPNKTEDKPKETTATAPSAAPTKPVESAPINKKTHHARLGLARALSKNTDDLSEAKKYYNEVIDIAPEVHDAYIESAELLATKDPMGAVDIYCRFPVSENPTFDDAYIFGEIVRILMKQEKYDDPRLQVNLIAMGKVMGLRVLEKYIEILDSKFKTKILKEVYAGVNGRSVDDPDMQAFFKAKCWI